MRISDWSSDVCSSDLGRHDAPFIVVAAARMTPERVEEELLGIEDTNGLVRPGLLEQGHGGTLYLDEIADMPLTTHGKTLRVLTAQDFTRGAIGSASTRERGCQYV